MRTERRWTAALAPLVCAALLLGPAGSSRAQPSPGPSPSPSGGGGGDTPSIHLLNPSGAYDPGLDPSGADDPPKISDKLDVDTTYHVVAWTNKAEAGDIVEASILFEGENEISIGTLDRLPDAPDVWELNWDVPDNLKEGSATLRVGLFGNTANGVEQKAIDEVPVDVEHRDGDGSDPTDAPAAETVELTWPSLGGKIGFYRPRGGSWIAVVDGTASQSTARVELEYSVSDPGGKPEFTKCGAVTTSSNAAFGVRPIAFSTNCTLAFGVSPLDVSAIAAVAEHGRDPANASLEQAAADVHPVHAYQQSPNSMTLSLNAAYVRGVVPGCLVFTATARDELGRLVQGANIDVHATGPDDQVAFGNLQSSGHKAPDDTDEHSLQGGSNCGGTVAGQQGVHRRPSQPDIKHEESTAGTGLSGPMNVQPGQWKFSLYSKAAGFAEVVAWIDDEELPEGASNRPQDDDFLTDGEPSATARAQWFSKAPTLTFAPAGSTAAPGTCQLYLAKARAGTDAVPGANIDLHAQSKLDSVRFCTPEGGTPLRAPDKGTHDPIDATQSRDKPASADAAPIVHTETEADSEGNVSFGLVAPSTGDATVTGWIDGETGGDNDVLDGAEARGTATASWADCANAAHVSFVNPSAYGSGTAGPGNGNDVSTTLDADRAYHVVVRSDCPDFAQSIEIGTVTGTTFKKLGDAQRIDGSDTYEFLWSPAPSDGSYKLRAHAVGAPADQDQTIVVNAQSGSGSDPTEQADETLELTAPGNGVAAGFTRGSTRVEGIASAGAEGVDIFYSKAASKDTPQGADWIACGYVDLSGSGTTAQPFFGSCALQGSDQPSQVTAIAALTADCGFQQNGCDAAPASTSRSLPLFKKDSGDAHRVYGYESQPLVALTPAENEARVNDCVSFSLSVVDETSQPMPNENVDLHLTGPGDDSGFCTVAGGTPSHPPDQGGHSTVPGHDNESAHGNPSGPDTYHIEGQTDAEGRFVFGIVSASAGDTSLLAWLDRDDDDVVGGDETSDGALMHWISAGRCTMSGTPDDDRLDGTRGADRICGLGGNDTIKGLRGNDVLIGGPGRDALFGGPGRDVLRGGPGPDRLVGGTGKDTCRGGPQRDALARCEPRRRR